MNDRMFKYMFKSPYIYVRNIEKRGNNFFIEFIAENGRRSQIEWSTSKVYKDLKVSNTSGLNKIFIRAIFLY